MSTKFGEDGAFVHSHFVQIFCEHLRCIKSEVYDLVVETLIKYSHKYIIIDCDKRRKGTYRDCKRGETILVSGGMCMCIYVCDLEGFAR